MLTVLAAVAVTGLLTRHSPQSKVSARVILSSRTVAAGGQLSGQVIVDNRSGRVLHVHGCGGSHPVWVDLSNGHYHPAGMAPACAGTIAVPAGRTTYQVQVPATYGSCSVGHADGDTPQCDPGDKLPPLPAGAYQASLGSADGFVPGPTPIPVRVTQP